MERVLVGLHAANPGAEVKPTPADPQRRKQAEISCEQGGIKKPPQSAQWASGREPPVQPLRSVPTFSLVYPMFFPNDPDSPALTRKYLREYIDRRKENGENCNNN